MPQLSGGLPLVGHSVEFVRSTIELLARAQRELGEIAAFTVFNRKMVAVFGPDAHEAVFRAPDAVLSPSEAYKIMTPVFGKDIVYDAPPEKMAEQLKMLLPALKDKRMRTYGEAVGTQLRRALGHRQVARRPMQRPRAAEPGSLDGRREIDDDANHRAHEKNPESDTAGARRRGRRLSGVRGGWLHCKDWRIARRTNKHCGCERRAR